MIKENYVDRRKSWAQQDEEVRKEVVDEVCRHSFMSWL